MPGVVMVVIMNWSLLYVYTGNNYGVHGIMQISFLRKSWWLRQLWCGPRCSAWCTCSWDQGRVWNLSGSPCFLYWSNKRRAGCLNFNDANSPLLLHSLTNLCHPILFKRSTSRAMNLPKLGGRSCSMGLRSDVWLRWWAVVIAGDGWVRSGEDAMEDSRLGGVKLLLGTVLGGNK